MLRPPPIPTLFPYTTLFRSGAVCRSVAVAAGHACRSRTHAGHALALSEGSRIAAPLPARPQHQDRKSTRLNSSHLGISYAVFCLKKKKQIQITQIIQDITTD